MVIGILIAFISGMAAKIISGFDDVATQTPIMSSLTFTRKGRLSFIIGMLLAVIVLLAFSGVLSILLSKLPFNKIISAGILIILAIIIYTGKLTPKRTSKTQRKIKKIKVSNKRIIKLIIIGFIVFFATAIDDLLIYTSVLSNSDFRLFTYLGIFIGALLEISAIFFFSKQISKIKYKKELTAAGLILLAIYTLV